jgi:hypothetical protein
MNSFHITVPQPNRTQKLRQTFLQTVFFVFLYEVILIFVVQHRPFDLTECLMLGIIYGLLAYFWPTRSRDYDIELDDDEIRLVQGRSVKTVVRRNRIRYLAEWNEGNRLVISEHSPTWTRIVGPAISIPRTLPEYEQIRTRALGWLQASHPS